MKQKTGANMSLERVLNANEDVSAEFRIDYSKQITRERDLS